MKPSNLVGRLFCNKGSQRARPRHHALDTVDGGKSEAAVRPFHAACLVRNHCEPGWQRAAVVGPGTASARVTAQTRERPRCKMDSFDEDGVYTLARAFFHAATKASGDSEDILPQEVTAPRLPRPCGQLLELTSELPRSAQDGEESKLSVFYVFAELFPDAVGENGAGGACFWALSRSCACSCAPLRAPLPGAGALLARASCRRAPAPGCPEALPCNGNPASLCSLLSARVPLGPALQRQPSVTLLSVVCCLHA